MARRRVKPKRKVPLVAQDDRAPGLSSDLQAAWQSTFTDLQGHARSQIRGLLSLGTWARASEQQKHEGLALAFSRGSHKRRGKVVRGRTCIRLLKNQLPAAFTYVRHLGLLEASRIVKADFDRHGHLIGWTVAADLETWEEWREGST